MKARNYLLLGIIAITMIIAGYLIIKNKISNQATNTTIEVTTETQKVCDMWQGTEVNKIYLCENTQGQKIYLQAFSCEDCDYLYFDINKKFIAACCSAMCAGEPSDKCKELEKKEYKCNYQKNLFDEICI